MCCDFRGENVAIAARDKRGRVQPVKKGRKENPLFFTSTRMFPLLCPRCAIKLLFSRHTKLGQFALAKDQRVGLSQTNKAHLNYGSSVE